MTCEEEISHASQLLSGLMHASGDLFQICWSMRKDLVTCLQGVNNFWILKMYKLGIKKIVADI